MTKAIDYEAIAGDYARHRRLHPGVLQQLIDLGRITPSTRVLEVGCGTGNYVVAIQDATRCQATGVDPSAAMLAEAEARTSRVIWLDGRAETLPIPDRSVDFLFSVDVIHHVEDRSAFFREAHRVLPPGGRICTVTDSEDDIVRRRPLSSHFPETIPHELRRYPPIAAIRTEMAEPGFAAIDTSHAELEYVLNDIQAYRDRAYSSLHLIPREAVAQGVRRLEAELDGGTVIARSLYTLIWGRRISL